MNKYIIVALVMSLLGCGKSTDQQKTAEVTTTTGTLEVVAELDINPGNVAVSAEGRVFTSIHPMRTTGFQLVEITDKTTYQAFPNSATQSTADTKSDDKLDTPLGIIFDKKNRLWAIDAGLNLGKTRLFAYDIHSKQEIYRFDIPAELAPANSFVQDVAIDEENEIAYLADFGNPGIIVVDIQNASFRKITHLPSMQSEDIDMMIDGKVALFQGSPARIGLNPITLSDDRETLYYGAMNGTRWYELPTALIRAGAEDGTIIKELKVTGPKPISDGVATDKRGNHYFTNVQNNSIDVLTSTGELKVLKQDALLDWPDNVRIHKDWLYIAVNQLHKTPAFTGAADGAELPFRILRLKFR